MLNKALKFTIFMMIILILSSFVTAPGTVVTNVAQGAAGYEIEVTPFSYMKQGQDFTANFHVFNISNGMPLTNNTISCLLRIYNQNGVKIFENNSLYFNSTSLTWITYMDSSFFQEQGLYSWIFNCNSSVYGGFRSALFKITDDGFDDTPAANSALPVIFFMLFGIIGLFILGFTGKFNRHEIINLVLQRGCFVIGIMLMMYTSTLLLNITEYANLDILSKEMIFLMTWIGWAGYVAMLYLVIVTLFDILRLKKENRAKEDMEVR